MMKSTSRETIFILCLLVIIFTIMGCVTPYPNKLVQLNRERYVCKADPAQFNKLQGKRILLSTIIDNSKNTTNLFYYNPKQTVGYELYYSSSSAMQPVVSYFWYSLKKAFECVGIRIEEYGLAYDAELSLTFTSLTDEEIKFTAVLIKMGKWLYTRDYVVSMPKVQTDENSILEQRQLPLRFLMTKIFKKPSWIMLFPLPLEIRNMKE
jgi:hypothetical protein